MDAQKYNRLKAEIEEAQREADKAQGAIDTLSDQIAAEYGCRGAKAARQLHAELEREADEAEAAYEAALKAFEEEWSHVRDDQNGDGA
jgi:predicted  nucleic acid-binding Zn-ribbon protein